MKFHQSQCNVIKLWNETSDPRCCRLRKSIQERITVIQMRGHKGMDKSFIRLYCEILPNLPILYSPLNALLHNFPTWMFIDRWLSNQLPKFPTLSNGWISQWPTLIEPMMIFSNRWREPIMRNYVLKSLNINLLQTNHALTSSIHFSTALTACSWESDESGRKEKYNWQSFA